VIETRKHATLNSLLQKFQSCQITLLATDSLSIQFFSHTSQSMQVFVFPPQKTKDGLSKISKTNQFLTYPVVFGLQYTIKFGTPTCKLAVFTSIQNEWNPIESVHLFQKFFRVDLHNNPIFRSVYCKSKFFNVVLLAKSNRYDSETSTSLKIPFQFWTKVWIPFDNEFLKPKIRINIWFTELIQNGKNLYIWQKSNLYPDSLIDELACEFKKQSNVCEFQ